MTLEEAKELLAKCERHEHRDDRFDTMKISWYTPGNVDGEEVASCFLSRRWSGSVGFYDDGGNEIATFEGPAARELRKCGIRTATCLR